MNEVTPPAKSIVAPSQLRIFAATAAACVPLRRRHQLRQPIGRHARVVVQQRDELALAVPDRGVVRSAEPPVGVELHDPNARIRASDELERAIGRAVVDDDDFEAISRVDLRLQTGEARVEILPSVQIQNENRDGWKARAHAAFRASAQDETLGSRNPYRGGHSWKSTAGETAPARATRLLREMTSSDSPPGWRGARQIASIVPGVAAQSQAGLGRPVMILGLSGGPSQAPRRSGDRQLPQLRGAHAVPRVAGAAAPRIRHGHRRRSGVRWRLCRSGGARPFRGPCIVERRTNEGFAKGINAGAASGHAPFPPAAESRLRGRLRLRRPARRFRRRAPRGRHRRTAHPECRRHDSGVRPALSRTGAPSSPAAAPG